MAEAARRGQVTTSDGVSISYLEQGEGPALVLVPGWSQTAAQWKHQIEHFAGTHWVIALDMRGHGESGKPDHGYRIARFAADLHDVLVALDLRDVVLAGHSMGCSVIWSYWDLFGGERVSRLVLVDQVAVLVADPAWSDGEAATVGAIFDYATVSALNAGLKSPAAQDVSRQLVSGMFTAATPPEEVEWTLEVNFGLPRPHAGTLLVDHCFADWRDVLPRIDVPALAIGGDASIFPAAGIHYVAKTIPGAQARIFAGDERGSHFMFWENPALFNDVVTGFLAS